MTRDRAHGTGMLKYIEDRDRWRAKIEFPGGRRVQRIFLTEEEGEAFLAAYIEEHIEELGYFYRRVVGRRDWWPKKPKRPRSGVSIRRRWEVLERDNHRCVYCGSTPNEARIVVDHVVPVSDGGSDEMDNLVAACVPCNAGKTNRKLKG